MECSISMVYGLAGFITNGFIVMCIINLITFLLGIVGICTLNKIWNYIKNN